MRDDLKKKLFGKGRVINHSSKALLVIETDSGAPIAHILGPKRKSPKNTDADGFKRADGKTILRHSGWWKILNFSTADVWEIGTDLLVPVSLMFPVKEDHFGTYKVQTGEWGEELAYVTSRLRNKQGNVVGYMTERYGKLTKEKAIQLAKRGKLDNVVVVTNKEGTVFLRTKRNAIISDNFVA
jgi:hypothetical protein